MYFTQVKLKNFGPFPNAEFHFQPHAVNWLVGNNGAGKSQMAGAIIAAILGKPVLSITDGGIGPSMVEVTMENDEKVESAVLLIGENSSDKINVSKTTGALTLQVLATMSESDGPRLLIGNERALEIDSSQFRDMEKFLPSTITGHPLWEDFGHCPFEIQFGSGGQHSVWELISQLLIRRRSQFKLPLIVDEALWRWPQNLFPLIFQLLEEIAKESQVIVLAPYHEGTWGGHVQFISQTSEARSLAGYNQWYETRRPNLQRPLQSRWIKGAIYPKQESRSCEFKEVKGGNPLGAIRGVVDQYAVAFLNAGLSQEGAIFWGIRDQDRAIIGVHLRLDECDELRRIVTERLHQIVPPIAPTAYRIDLHPVSDGSVTIDDLYIVEVRVPSIRRTLLFATGGQEVYVKTDAGKRKLSTLELQQELVRRLGVDPDF